MITPIQRSPHIPTQLPRKIESVNKEKREQPSKDKHKLSKNIQRDENKDSTFEQKA